MTIVSALVSLVFLSFAAGDAMGPIRGRALPATVELSRTRATVAPPTHLCVVFLNQVRAGIVDGQAFDREVNRIWAPYGIAIDGLNGSCRAYSGPSVMVRLQVMSRMSTASTMIPDTALGSISFVGGRPEPVIGLWLDEAAKMMNTTIGQLTDTGADPRLRLLLARVLGRSLAHELGHYLLASQAHTPGGLMRPTFASYDVVTADPRVFALESDQLAALSRRVEAWQAAPRGASRGAVARANGVELVPANDVELAPVNPDR
jgi:hypothetical protein